MSAAQHSAGPWWVTESGIRNRAGYICFTRPATRFEGQEERFARESAERAADHLLIAAAPDLLEALRRCRFDSLNMSLADLEFCSAAYAKATESAA